MLHYIFILMTKGGEQKYKMLDESFFLNQLLKVNVQY